MTSHKNSVFISFVFSLYLYLLTDTHMHTHKTVHFLCFRLDSIPFRSVPFFCLHLLFYCNMYMHILRRCKHAHVHHQNKIWLNHMRTTHTHLHEQRDESTVKHLPSIYIHLVCWWCNVINNHHWLLRQPILVFPICRVYHSS